jgi:surfactin synthase thioesterase subunit
MAAPPDEARWWIRTGERTSPALRLLCFPFAGGAASLYSSWATQLGSDVEVLALQLPGRENRLREPALHAMPEAVAAIVRALPEAIFAPDAVPFCFFGCSLGGLVAFETIRALRRAGRPLPTRLFVAASSAPHRNHARQPPVYRRSDAEFRDELRKFQGTPEAVLNNAELMAVILPTLRADFELLETYRCEPEPALPLPIAAYGGLGDGEVPPDAVAEWGEHTSGGFSLQFLPGDHFFIKSAQAQLLDLLKREMEAVVRRHDSTRSVP